jgi:hypothetical protein
LHRHRLRVSGHPRHGRGTRRVLEDSKWFGHVPRNWFSLSNTTTTPTRRPSAKPSRRRASQRLASPP